MLALQEWQKNKALERESYFVNLFHFLFVFALLSYLCHAALWSPAGKADVLAILYVMITCVFVTFPYGILGQVWNLIVSIPDLCLLLYFLALSLILITDPMHRVYLGEQHS